MSEKSSKLLTITLGFDTMNGAAMSTSHSFIPDNSIAPLQVHYYSEVLLTTA